jgi:hypothetical protein
VIGTGAGSGGATIGFAAPIAFALTALMMFRALAEPFTASGFLARCLELGFAEVLRAAAARLGDLRTALVRLALAARFFFTELLFMELTIAFKFAAEQRI